MEKITPRNVSISIVWRSPWGCLFLLAFFAFVIFLICLFCNEIYGTPNPLEALYITHVRALFRSAGGTLNAMHALASTYDDEPPFSPELADKYRKVADIGITRFNLLHLRFTLAIVPPRYKDIHAMCIECIDKSIHMYSLFKQYIQEPHNLELYLELEQLAIYVNGLLQEISFQLSYLTN